MKSHFGIITFSTLGISSLILCGAAVAQSFDIANQLSFSGSAKDLVLKTEETFIPLDSSLSTPRTPFSIGTNSGNEVIGNIGQSTLTVTLDQSGSTIDPISGSRFTGDLDIGSVVVTLNVAPSSENDVQSSNIILNQDNDTGLDNVQTLDLVPTLSATGDITRRSPVDSNSPNISPASIDLNAEILVELPLPSISSTSVFQ